MTKKKIILWIVSLVLLDQGIKVIIVNWFIDTKFDVIDSIVGFHPLFNDKYSYFNVISNLNLGLLPHAILLFILQMLLIMYYDFSKITKSSVRIVDFIFIFGQAALVCVFCGFFFWKDGILDYIFLYPFIFDWKDIYLNIFVILFLYNNYKNRVRHRISELKITGYLRLRYLKLLRLITKLNSWKL